MAQQNQTPDGRQNTKGQSDDPRRADESGEPGVAGRSHGQVIDDKTMTNDDSRNRSKDEADEKRKPSQDWESGRQDAMKG